jgi:acyl dehydratase
MPFKYEELINKSSDEIAFSYTDSHMLLYNLSIGMGRDPINEQELPFVFERPALQVMPSAAAILGGGRANLLGNVNLDWTKILHGEQRLSCHSTIPPAADLIGKTRVSEIVDKGADKGALITLQMDVRLASGEPLYTTENVTFARGDGGCGGPTAAVKAPHALPEREPDIIHISETRGDQALLYRLNGDRNPLHAYPALAAKAGFERPILHGLCTYGIACRAVLASVCDYQTTRMKSFDVRFTSPVYPGDSIHTDIWIDAEVVSFRCRVEARNIIALNNGRCEISP